ncbi:MAG: TIGR03668 family PPOX class F420-dependent oxidoreductase [Anaerolinea sp.]|nr:TIGR03668 family PPOX class F420-dependent oxidoreductase [Anaerolinea sp.]
MEPSHAALLEECRVGHLGTVGPSGRPHLVPVCYALYEGLIVIAVDEKPKRETLDLARLRNIRRDARVTLLVDRYSEDWSRLAWLRIDAIASVQPAGGAHPGALAALRARYPQYAAMVLEERPLVTLQAERVSSWQAGGNS